MNRCDECKHKDGCVCVPYGCECFELDLEEHDKQIRAEAIDEFQEWLKTRIVGLDRSNNEVMVVGKERWWPATEMYNAICKGMSEDEIIKEFEEQLKKEKNE